MERESKGYAWAVAAGSSAAFAAISAKFFTSQLMKYSLVILFNVTMWGCYVNSLRALSSLQATVTNFATNFLSSGLAGYFLFGEALSTKIWLYDDMHPSKAGTSAHMYLHLLDNMLVLTADFVGIRDRMWRIIASGSLLI